MNPLTMAGKRSKHTLTGKLTRLVLLCLLALVLAVFAYITAQDVQPPQEAVKKMIQVTI
jgi:hypothetical protein